MLELSLEHTFCYVHEPLRADATAIPLLGNSELVDELRDRIVHSRGGTFLVSGFRGVGKSTIVLRALDSLAAVDDGADVVVPVVLSVARAADTDRLLFAVVRRIFESLNDRGLLARLPAESQRSLLLAYMRTSLAFKQTHSDSTERGGSGEAGGGTAMKLVVPKVSMSAKRTRSMATEAQFLAYSETDVEHDIMRIVSLLDQDGYTSTGARHRLRRLWPWRQGRSPRIRLAVVLDEVDKLTDGESGLATVERLLGGIKNILSLSGVHFLVVAGPDLHDRVLRDVARGNSVYESVFGWRTYVPCSWSAVDRLLGGVLADGVPVVQEPLVAFGDYLRFKARGMPRRLLQEFNEFVIWRGDRPVLVVPAADADRIFFYARLESILRDYLARGGRGALFPLPIDEDRRRLAAYYMIDWVLRSEGESFRAIDLVREGNDAVLDPLLRVSLRGVERLLAHLAEQQVLEVLREPNASATFYGNVAESQQIVYRLSDDVIDALLRFAVRNEAERAALDLSQAVEFPLRGMVAPSGDAAFEGRSPRVVAGRYELEAKLGQGGMGSVWLGRDRVLGRVVAVKMLDTHSESVPDLVVRFRREAELTSQLEHPHIVRCFDVVEFEGGFAMVLEFLDGISLQQSVANDGPMTPEATAGTALMLAEALDYLERKQVVRLDMKPANVMMHPERGPIVIDLGIARQPNSTQLTQAGAMLGTPNYMSPEQVEGTNVDHRSDIHALGLVVYYCLTGMTALREPQLPTLFNKLLTEEIDVSDLPVSQEFRTVLAKALRRDPAERYQHAAEFIADLKLVPELGTQPQPLPRHPASPDGVTAAGDRQPRAQASSG